MPSYIVNSYVNMVFTWTYCRTWSAYSIRLAKLLPPNCDWLFRQSRSVHRPLLRRRHHPVQRCHSFWTASWCMAGRRTSFWWFCVYTNRGGGRERVGWRGWMNMDVCSCWDDCGYVDDANGFWGWWGKGRETRRATEVPQGRRTLGRSKCLGGERTVNRVKSLSFERLNEMSKHIYVYRASK